MPSGWGVSVQYPAPIRPKALSFFQSESTVPPMSLEIKIPAVGESITSGLLSVWHKNDGDAVAAGDALFTLETDKVSTEIVAEKAGVLKIAAAAGSEVKIGETVGTIEEGGAAAKAPAARKASPATKAAPTPKASAGAKAPAAKSVGGGSQPSSQQQSAVPTPPPLPLNQQ